MIYFVLTDCNMNDKFTFNLPTHQKMDYPQSQSSQTSSHHFSQILQHKMKIKTNQITKKNLVDRLGS